MSNPEIALYRIVIINTITGDLLGASEKLTDQLDAETALTQMWNLGPASQPDRGWVGKLYKNDELIQTICGNDDGETENE